MKTYTFSVKDTNEDIYTFSSPQRILDIQDGRHKQIPGCSDCDAIHYSFFEQLTRQVSVQITKVFGEKLSKTFSKITCGDKFFLRREDCFYLFAYLHGKVTSGYLWIKCLAKYDPLVLSQPVKGLIFQVCNDEEHRACDIDRFGRSHNTVGISQLKQSFELHGKTLDNVIPDSVYPDVVLRVQMHKTVTKAVRKRIYEEVVAFVQTWNDQADEYSQIHDAQLYDRSPDKNTVCIVMDFGHCDPVALEQLYHYLLSNNEGIKEITI